MTREELGRLRAEMIYQNVPALRQMHANLRSARLAAQEMFACFDDSPPLPQAPFARVPGLPPIASTQAALPLEAASYEASAAGETAAYGSGEAWREWEAHELHATTIPVALPTIAPDYVVSLQALLLAGVPYEALPLLSGLGAPPTDWPLLGRHTAQ
jgi:hypothetical protein